MASTVSLNTQATGLTGPTSLLPAASSSAPQLAQKAAQTALGSPQTQALLQAMSDDTTTLTLQRQMEADPVKARREHEASKAHIQNVLSKMSTASIIQGFRD